MYFQLLSIAWGLCENKEKSTNTREIDSILTLQWFLFKLRCFARVGNVRRVKDLGGMQRWKLTLKSFETSSIIIIIQFVLCVWVYLCTRTLAWNMTTIKWCKWTFQMEFMCWSFVEFQMNIKFMSGEAVMQSIHICACAISMSCFCVQCVCVCCGITHIQYICICTIYFIWKWQQVASRVEPIML